MRHEFHPDAYAEYEEAARYYAERNPELAARFIATVEETIERICDSPGRWRRIDEDVRRCLTHVFPYAVLYTIEPEFVLVVAVMHCSREPATGGHAGRPNQRLEPDAQRDARGSSASRSR